MPSRPKWGDFVALIAPTDGPKEGLVVDVLPTGHITVESKDGHYVGSNQWSWPNRFYVIREARIA